jgi:hypothetical protein
LTTKRTGRVSWRDEAGFFVSSIIIRFIVFLSLFGVAAYDTTQVVIAQVRAESVSRAAATAGADTYYRTKRADLAHRDALLAAQEVDPSARIVSFNVDHNGVVTVGAEKSAKTLVVRRVGILKKFNRQRATDQQKRIQ